MRRRELLIAALALPAPALAAGCGEDGGAGDGSGEDTQLRELAGSEPRLPPTPACDDGDEPTAAQTEGPFFTPDSPERTSLHEPGLVGESLLLTGVVLSTSCAPQAEALLDFWQADGDGAYDNEGFRLRGHQFADAKGRFRLETVVPAPYPGRTRHIHVKVQPRGGQILTTQLYFPGEALNASDGIYDPALEVKSGATADWRRASFVFVLETGDSAGT